MLARFACISRAYIVRVEVLLTGIVFDTALVAKLETALSLLEAGNTEAARNLLEAFLQQVAAMRDAGQISWSLAGAITWRVRQILDLMDG